MKKRAVEQPKTSQLEHEVLKVIWTLNEATAEDVRLQLSPTRTLKESTVRTILKRLENKGAVTHRIEGRTYVYKANAQPESLGVAALQSVADKFFAGSMRQLVLGMANHDVISPDELRALAKLIEDSENTAADTQKKSTK